jgi:hypothetical protein
MSWIASVQSRNFTLFFSKIHFNIILHLIYVVTSQNTTAMNLRVPQKAGIFLNSWVTVRVPKRTELHRVSCQNRGMGVKQPL